MVATDPLDQRSLDPACGSGAAIFAAVRTYLAAAGSEAALSGARAEREASGIGFPVTMASRELHRWLSASAEKLLHCG